MFTHPNYTMVNVSDMGRSVALYRDALGLPLKFETPGWSEFATGATTLALHKAAPAPTGGVDPCAEPRAGTCCLGFSVPNLDQAYEQLGVRFAVTPTVRAEEGIRLAVCLDPDGLAISLAEPLQPER